MSGAPKDTAYYFIALLPLKMLVIDTQTRCDRFNQMSLVLIIPTPTEDGYMP